VAVAPTQVTTTWNEKVTQVQESVTGPDQAQWSTGSVDGTGSEYSVALRPSPPPGVYTVNWQVKSDDGDIVNGSWTFTVSPASGQ
jgi:methionine-rich copper-binding protein CopC